MAPPNATWNGTDSQGNPLRWGMPGLTWNGPVPQPPTSKRMPQLRVLLGFGNMADHTLEETAQAVSAGLYGNAAFPVAPPVTKAALDAARAAFSTAIAAAKQGGPADTADKNNKRDILIDLLRKLAGYVQANHGNNLANLLSSGFHAVSMNRAQSQLDAPIISDILNGLTGQLLPGIAPIANANGYEARYAALGAPAAGGAAGAPGPWQAGGVFSNTRDIAVNALTPGTIYAIQIRALGGSTGYSDWSDPVQHMSM